MTVFLCSYLFPFLSAILHPILGSICRSRDLVHLTFRARVGGGGEGTLLSRERRGGGNEV